MFLNALQKAALPHNCTSNIYTKLIKSRIKNKKNKINHLYLMCCVVKVRGLCGTLNWNQYDDFTTPEGDVENGVLSFARKFTSEKCRLPGGATPDPCTTYTQRRYYAETVCSVIHSPVFQVMDAESVQKTCFYGCFHLRIHVSLWSFRGVTMW